MISKSKQHIKKAARDFTAIRRMVKGLHQIEPHSIARGDLENLGEEIIAAQKLHAEVYLRRGFIEKKDIHGGRMTHKADPHQQHALYFVVKKSKQDGTKQIVATARQIYHHPDKGFLSFPVVERANLNLEMLKSLVSHNPEKCVEISGLAKHRDTSSATVLLLYRAMWHYSLEQKHQLWVMACDVRLYRRLRLLFGPAIKQIGEETPYRGGNVIPAMLNPQEALTEFIRISRRRALMFGISRKVLIGFFIDGLPRRIIPLSDKRYIDSILGKKR